MWEAWKKSACWLLQKIKLGNKIRDLSRGCFFVLFLRCFGFGRVRGIFESFLRVLIFKSFLILSILNMSILILCILL